jgi:hypothetical protein
VVSRERAKKLARVSCCSLSEGLKLWPMLRFGCNHTLHFRSVIISPCYKIDLFGDSNSDCLSAIGYYIKVDDTESVKSNETCVKLLSYVMKGEEFNKT